MNEDNFAYLKDQLRHLGIGERIDKDLAEKMQAPHSFSLMHGAEFGQDAAFAILKFKKSTESDLFFLTNYTLHLVAAGVAPRLQTFRVAGKSGITMHEGYNLLSGRAVLQKIANDNGEDYLAWQQLNFNKRDFHQNYIVKAYKHDNAGYIDATSKLSIFPMAPEAVMQFHKALQQGDLHRGLFRTSGKEVELFMEYDPAAKAIILYDREMKRLNAGEVKAFIRPEYLHGNNLLPKKERSHKKRLSI
jgi:hypothetical protein